MVTNDSTFAPSADPPGRAGPGFGLCRGEELGQPLRLLAWSREIRGSA